jgi:hypothetical protein
MHPVRRVLSRLSLVGLSLGGLFGAHYLAFMFAAPHVHDRSELLAATGHGSWIPVAVAVATSLFLAFLRGSGHGWSELALLQVVGFVALEGVERVGAHDGVSQLLSEPVFYLGLVLQLVVSLVATLLVRVAVEVGRLLAGRRFSPRGSVTSAHTFVTRVRRVISVSAEAWNLRGPPSPLAL